MGAFFKNSEGKGVFFELEIIKLKLLKLDFLILEHIS